MTIRIVEDELVLTRAEYNEYMARYNELAARTRVCVEFEGWVRGLKEQEARQAAIDRILNVKPFSAQNAGQTDIMAESMRVGG